MTSVELQRPKRRLVPQLGGPRLHCGDGFEQLGNRHHDGEGRNHLSVTDRGTVHTHIPSARTFAIDVIDEVLGHSKEIGLHGCYFPALRLDEDKSTTKHQHKLIRRRAAQVFGVHSFSRVPLFQRGTDSRPQPHATLTNCTSRCADAAGRCVDVDHSRLVALTRITGDPISTQGAIV